MANANGSIETALAEDALDESFATKPVAPRPQDDPYGLEPPPGRTLRRQRQDRLAHLLLTGLRVIQMEKEQEKEQEQEQAREPMTTSF